MTTLKYSSCPVLADFPMLSLPMPDKDESPPPASEYVLESLQHWAYSPSNDSSSSPLELCLVCQVEDKDKMNHQNCSCCQDGPTTNQDKQEKKLMMMTQLPCGHVYHTGCISQWLAYNCTCPTCRYELPTDDFLFEMGREERMESYNISKKLTAPADVWMPKKGRQQAILTSLDLATSTTESIHWQCPSSETISRTLSMKDMVINTPNIGTVVQTAKSLIASSA